MPHSIPPLFENDVEASKVLDVRHPSGRDILVASQLRSMWKAFHPYADREFITRLRHAVRGIRDHQDPGGPRAEASRLFHRCYWEMYVGCALLEQGVLLVPRAQWDKTWQGEGPDIWAIVDGLSVWVECVAPGPGDGPDAVPEVRLDRVARLIPVDQINLRVLGALNAKRNQRSKYVMKRIVKPDDAFVVAINAHGVPSASLDDDPPWITRALYGLGDYAITYNVTMEEWSSPFLTRQPSIAKRSKEAVDAELFRNGKAPDVSGVIYSTVDAWNAAPKPSDGIFFVHNMTAAVPLPDRWLRDSVSYSVTINGDTGTLNRADPP